MKKLEWKDKEDTSLECTYVHNKHLDFVFNLKKDEGVEYGPIAMTMSIYSPTFPMDRVCAFLREKTKLTLEYHEEDPLYGTSILYTCQQASLRDGRIASELMIEKVLGAFKKGEKNEFNQSQDQADKG